MRVRSGCRLIQVQRWAVVCLTSALLGVVGFASDVRGQMAGAEAAKSGEQTTDERGSGPLAGPRLARGPSAPGVVMGFGAGGGNRRGVGGYRANLRLYRRVLGRLDLPAAKNEMIRAIYERHDGEAKVYFQGHAAEMRQLRAVVRKHNEQVERAEPKDTKPADTKLDPEVAEAVARLRTINRQKPAADPFMVEIWDVLDTAEQGRFVSTIDEIRAADRARAAGDKPMMAGKRPDRKPGEAKSFLEVRIAFIDELLATEGEGKLTDEDRQALKRARVRIAAMLGGTDQNEVARPERRRRGRGRALLPPKAREIEIEEGDDSVGGEADG